LLLPRDSGKLTETQIVKRGEIMKDTAALFSFVSISVALLTSQPALAQRTGVAKGAGLEVCERIMTDMKDNHVDSAYTAWVAGYISAYNLFGDKKRIEEIPDDAYLDAYLQEYCRENPLDKVIWASMSLINELGGYRPPYMKK
jgi:hypothetical protein